MTEITFKGGSVHLKDQQINESGFVPDPTVLDNDLNQVTLVDYVGKKESTSVIPSIDTGVCDQQTHKFNSGASKEEGIVLTTSTDLPFAQERWCASADLDNVITLSSHRDLLFGKNYSVVMEELRLLARTVLVLGVDNKVVYKEIVSEDTDLPDSDVALATYKNI